MKTLGTQLAYILGERQLRRNVRALLKYVGVILLVIVLNAVLFQVVMAFEGQRHSWISGFYWALVTMSTLGFGDITFTSDLGRLFSIYVVASGVLLLLIVLPFAFIRFFYAPWLEAQIRTQAPREAPADAAGHVVICAWDSIAPDLIERLELQEIPYYVIEPDPARASRMASDGISVVVGDPDSRTTYERLRAARARLVFVNGEDTENTNVIITVREVAPDVPIAAIAERRDSVDILELAGATTVLELKHRLGEHLANRVNAGLAQAHVIGSFRDLLIAEFPVHNTPLAGRTIRETRLREETGLNIVGIWRQAQLVSAHPDSRLTEMCLPVVVGTREQIESLNELLVIYDTNFNPVVVIGGGKVGRSAAGALKARNIPVHMIEKNGALRDRIGDLPDRLFIGDAARREVLAQAGLEEAPTVLLTTNDDAVNIYLAVYCRRLNPELRIVSRITHERNMEAIQRAGADLALSYADLGVESILSTLEDREMVVLGEGVELHHVPAPGSVEGKTLEESGIGARTGLNVVAIETTTGLLTNPRPSTVLKAGAELLMIGTKSSVKEFLEIYA